MGNVVYRFRWALLLGWMLIALLLAVLAPKPDLTVGESSDLLPADTPVHLALGELSKHFADKSSISSIVIVVERRDGTLGAQDLAEIEKMAAALTTANPGEDFEAELANITMRSPGTFVLAGKANPLLSRDQHAALIWLSLPYNYITKPAARLVK